MTSYKFSRSHRLTTSEQFKHTFRKARKIYTKYGAFFICRNSLSSPRLGVIVPKKSVKKAQQRYYVKRIVREWFRLNQHSFTEVDLVFLAYREVQTLSGAELWQYLRTQQEQLTALPLK